MRAREGDPIGSAARKRSQIVTIETPRGRVEVMQQEMRGLSKRSGWRMFWFARQAGKREWAQANTSQEAIRKASLLPPKKAVGWLERAVAEVRSQLDETNLGESDSKRLTDRSGLIAFPRTPDLTCPPGTPTTPWLQLGPEAERRVAVGDEQESVGTDRLCQRITPSM